MLYSIDVGSGSLFSAEGSYSSGMVTVSKTMETKLSAETVEDGNIKNRASFCMSLSKLLPSGSKACPTVFTINSNAILSRHLELPSSKPSELYRMMRNEMLQTTGDANEFVYEYSAGSGAASQANLTGLWAYAMPKDMVDEYYTLGKSVHIKPVALDIHPNSVEKLFLGALVNARPIARDSVLFADVGEDLAEIHLFSDGQRAFSRISPLSVSDFKIVLGNAGYGGTGDIFDTLDVTSEQFRSDGILNNVFRQYIGRLADELQKMVQFQLRRDSANPVTAVYIYGAMACVTGLADALGAALGIHVENVESISKVRTQNLRLYKHINAIGALIRL